MINYSWEISFHSVFLFHSSQSRSLITQDIDRRVWVEMTKHYAAKSPSFVGEWWSACQNYWIEGADESKWEMRGKLFNYHITEIVWVSSKIFFSENGENHLNAYTRNTHSAHWWFEKWFRCSMAKGNLASILLHKKCSSDWEWTIYFYQISAMIAFLWFCLLRGWIYGLVPLHDCEWERETSINEMAEYLMAVMKFDKVSRSIWWAE